jgi:hypothetical protein
MAIFRDPVRRGEEAGPMRGRTRVFIAALAAAVVTGVALGDRAGAAEAKGSAMSEKEKAQKEPFPNDLGPDSIDVSAYPAPLKKKYEYLKECAQCHTMARPINSQIFEDDAWKRYVKRMKAKPGCDIKHAKEIYEFLRDDSKIRKIGKKAVFKAHRLGLLKQFKEKHPDRWTLLFENRTPEQQVAKELPGW